MFAPARQATRRSRVRRRFIPLLAIASVLLTVPGGLSGASAATGYTVTLQGPDSQVESGVPFVLTGSVTPAAAKSDVLLQRQIRGRFHTVAKAQLDSSSDFEFAQIFQTPGGYTYRVVKPKSKTLAQGTSPVLRVWVASSSLPSGTVMRAGDGLISADGSSALTMQASGNLAITLTMTGRVLWSTHTEGHVGATAVLRNDGDLVVDDSGGNQLWSSNSGGHPTGTYTLSLLHTFNLVVTGSGGTQLWSSNTHDVSIHANEMLTSGQYLLSMDRAYKLAVESSGDVQLIQTGTGDVLWDADTSGNPGAYVTMTSTGDLEITASDGEVLLSTGTGAYPGSIAALRTDGNLVVTDPAGDPTWASTQEGAPLGDDYPTKLRDAPIDSIIDPWRFYNRECVSFVAWRLNSANGIAFNDFMDGGRWGDGANWDNNAEALGIPVNTVPAIGAIAQSDSLDHVAWVAGVGPGTVTIEDYNYVKPGTYDERVVPTSSYIYIHIADLAS